METMEVVVTRMIPAKAEQVYDVWLDPKHPAGAWSAGEKAIVNAVVDGLFYWRVNHEGRPWAHYGRFLRLERGKVAEYTWMSEATKGLDSVVTVTFEAKDNQTEVTIRHAGIPDDAMGQGHRDGWTWFLSNLAEKMAQ